MVDITIGGIAPVPNDPGKREDKRRPAPSKTGRQRERRKNRTDRRQSVRDGIVVTLSNRKERRKQPDRRSAADD